MRSTLLRLERRASGGEAPATDLLQETYDELAAAVLAAGAARGYLGRDPLGALAQLDTPDARELRIAQMTLELWQAFFATFRADEADFEAARFRARAEELAAAVEALPPGAAPDPDLTVELLASLVDLWSERQEAVDQRLDLLIGELQDHQRQLGSSDLERAYQQDELQQAEDLVRKLLRDLGQEVADDEKLTRLVARIMRTWRDERARQKDQLEAIRARHRALLEALAEVASGRDRPEEVARVLDGGAAALVDAIADLVLSNRELEKEQRELQGRLATAEAERATMLAEVAQRDELLARYEMAEFGGESEDQRLALYRDIVARLESGREAGELIERVRELERVLVISRSEHDQALTLLDRLLDSLVKSLSELRKRAELTEDPRRFRPRLLGTATYRLKTLPGTMQACRDAARDLLVYTGRARWAEGVQRLNRDFRKLRKVFQEMVRLVGDAREQSGGPPPASITIDVGTTDGLASLPAVLAVDLRALAKSNSQARIMGDVASLLEDVVGLFHGSLSAAIGEELPRSEPPKREAAKRTIARLAEELLSLAGHMDAAFAEAKARNWQIAPEDGRLLDGEQTLQLAARDLDGMTEVLHVLRGAPPAEFNKLPKARAGRADLDRLFAAAKSRVSWLEDIARYRVEVGA